MSASLRPTHYENSVREHKNISFFLLVYVDRNALKVRINF